MSLRKMIVAVMLTLCALAGRSETVGDFSYSYSLSTKEATLTWYSGSSSHVTIPTSFTVAETYEDDDGETHTRHHLITVTAVGKNAFADKEFIASVSFHDRIKTIGVDAFRGCTALKSFKTPSSLQSLGSYALSGCTGLETAEINGNNLVVGSNLFIGCTGLRSVVYGSGVVKIGGGEEVTYSSCWAFGNCTNLTSIVVESTAVRCIPDCFCNVPSLTHLSFAGAITNIGTSALSGCTGLTTIDATLRPVSVGASAFSGCTNLNTPIEFYDCTEIGSGAFWNCRSMTGILSLPKLSTVPFEAFYGCSAITGLSLESAETIGNESFYNCESLAIVSFSDTLKTIGSSSFYNCKSLVSVLFPGSLRTIDSRAFKNCTSLHSVSLPDSLASIGSAVFSGCTDLETAHIDGNGSLQIGNSLFYNCTNLEIVVIGQGVKSIEDGTVYQGWNSVSYYGMFYNCDRLKRVEIRTTRLPKLPSYMFRATPVEEVYIAGGCNEIGEGAFSQCTSLTEITGDFSTVTNIANNAFNGCSNLAKVPSFQNMEIMGSSAFYNCSALTGSLFLPKLVSVPSSAFYCCRRITGVNLGSATTIGSDAFCGCWTLASVSLSDSLKTIGSRAFQYCYDLASVSFPDSLKSIGSYAFQSCRSLKSFKTPHSLKTLDDSALLDCTGLESAEIDGDNLRVGRRLFSGCTSLQTVVYGGGVASISGGYVGNMGGRFYAFSACTNLEGVIVRSTAVREIPVCFCNVSSMKAISFAGVITNIGNYALSDCSGLTTIDATFRPISVGTSAFSGCVNLNPNIDFSDCTSIGMYAFYNCRSMTGTISLPRLATVSSSAFSGCRGIGSVQFDANLTSIGSSAFYGCSSASNFVFRGAPPSVGSYAFNNVKSGAVGTYTAAHAAEWEAVIDDKGYWNGLKMKPSVEYTITYNANNGSGLSTNITAVAGEEYTIADILNFEYTWEKHYFQSWALETGKECLPMDKIVVNGNITLDAKWAKDYDFTVRFHANGGSGEDTEQHFRYNEVQNLDKCPFSRGQGKNIFLGWQPGTVDFDWLDHDGLAISTLLTDEKRLNVYSFLQLPVNSQSDITYDANCKPIVHLYAIWTTTLKVDFFNDGGAKENGIGGNHLEPCDLANYISWSSIYRTDRIRGSGEIELPPGRHTLNFAVDAGYETFASSFKVVQGFGCKDDEVHPEVENCKNGHACNFVLDSKLDQYGRGSWKIFYVKVIPDDAGLCALEVDVDSSMSEYERANWLPEYEFDLNKVVIEIKKDLPGAFSKKLTVAPNKRTIVPAGSYWIQFQYAGKFWYPDSYSEHCDFPVGGSKKFNVTFKPDKDQYTTYAVILNPKGGEVSRDIVQVDRGNLNTRTLEKKEDGNYDLPQAKKDGCLFDGWFTAEGEEMTMNNVASLLRFKPLEVYAHWTPLPTIVWVNNYETIMTASSGDIVTAAKMTAANGCRTVGECYALGIDPEDPDDDLKITNFEMKDGKPVITLNHTEDGSGNSFAARIKTVGKADLSDAEWRELPEDGDDTMRFFKVEVEFP